MQEHELTISLNSFDELCDDVFDAEIGDEEDYYCEDYEEDFDWDDL